MSHVRRSDWAATVPWDGILDKPASIGQPTDIGDLSAAGFSLGDSPEWNGSKFVPGAGGGGGGSGPSGIQQLDSPGVATKRIKPGTTQFEYVWLRETFDVRQYGADPTGSGDSTDSFNAAISALNSGGGGALVVPAGRYRISSALNRILARCWVQGAGQGAAIIEATGDVFWVTSGSFFGATGLTLLGSSDGATGIRIEDSASTDNFLLRDLRITGFGYAVSIETVARSGWVERCRLEATRLALLLTASDSFVRGVSIYNGGDNTRNAFEMTGYRNQVSDFKILGDSSNFKKGLFVNDGGNHLISSGMIIGCDEEAISLSNGTGGVSGCRVQNISWLTIGTDPDVVSYDPATNWVDDLYEIGTAGGGGGTGMILVTAPADSSDPGADNQVANDGTYFYSYAIGLWKRVALSSFAAFPAEYTAWRSAVIANGGTFGTNSEAWALALIVALEAKSYSAKVVYLLPLLGSNLNAAVVPLRDSIGAGNATNHNFVGGDFNEALGLQGNGSTKYLDSNVKPSQLGSSDNGGLGYWENNISLGGNVEPMGCYNNAGTNRYVLDLRGARRSFRWGDAANDCGDTSAATNGSYYGQRSGATLREMFFNAVSLGTNTTSDATAGAGDETILIVGCNEAGVLAPWPGRCAVAYMTDGTLSGADIADLDALLTTYLIGPTGR